MTLQGIGKTRTVIKLRDFKIVLQILIDVGASEMISF